MSLLSTIKRYLSGENDAAFGDSLRHIEHHRDGIAAAGKEHSEATARRDAAAAALSAAEHTYDADPTDKNGKLVIGARQAHDLAVLRCNKACDRLEEHRAEHANHEKALQRQRHEKALGELESHEATIRHSIATSRTALASASPHGPLAALVAKQDDERLALVALGAAKAELDAHPRELAALEAELADCSPELPEMIEAAKAAVAARRKADVLERASVESFMGEIADSLAVVGLASVILDHHMARIQAAHEAHLFAAMSVDSKPLGPQALDARVLYAKYKALPVQLRDPKAHALALGRALQGGNLPLYHNGAAHVSHEEMVDIASTALSTADLHEKVTRLQQDRAFAAGDVNETIRRQNALTKGLVATGQLAPAAAGAPVPGWHYRTQQRF